MDATIIAAPSSTKNSTGERDPEMHQTKKGNQWRVSRTQAADLWCCTEDGSRPPETGLQAGFKPPGAAGFKRRGGERLGESHPLRGGRYVLRR